MSARDDYPEMAYWQTIPIPRANYPEERRKQEEGRALDEIDRLRALVAEDHPPT